MTKAMRRLAPLCLVILSGCHDPGAYTLGPSTADQVLSVTLSVNTLPANGIARSTIVAQLDPRTDADKRSVSFTTSAGTLIGGGKEALTTSVEADTTGKAVVELRSTTTPGTAHLQVTAGSVSRSASVEFTPVSVNDLYEVVISRTSIPADGFSTTQVTVRLKVLGTTAQRLVKFETSAGTLLGAGLTGTKLANVPADANGVATVELQSDRTIGTARLNITALDATREIQIAFVATEPSQLITVVSDTGTVAADGVTPILVTARVSPNLPAGRRTVTFRTTVGLFTPGKRDEITADADASNVARASLVSSTTGTSRVTATVDGTTAETIVTFAPAFPDRVFVSPAASTLTSGQSTVVTVTLLRNVGDVSPRLQVTYSATTSSGASIGGFGAITLTNNGVSTANFSLGTTTYSGPVTIRATAEGGASGTATIVVP